VRWHKLGEVESKYTSEKLVVSAILVPKIFTVGRNLAKFWRKISLHSFLRHGVLQFARLAQLLHSWQLFQSFLFYSRKHTFAVDGTSLDVNQKLHCKTIVSKGLYVASYGSLTLVILSYIFGFTIPDSKLPNTLKHVKLHKITYKTSKKIVCSWGSALDPAG